MYIYCVRVILTFIGKKLIIIKILEKVINFMKPRKYVV